jgi:hypothetical protein
MTLAVFLLLLILLSCPRSSLCSQGGVEYKDVLYESVPCNACAQKADCSTSTPPYGTSISYCGDGVLRLPAQDNQTVATAMCCESPNPPANDTTGANTPWHCQPYSGPLDGGAGVMLSGYQCFNPAPTNTGRLFVLSVGLMIGIVLVALFSLSVLAMCLSCYVCGRCRLSPAWAPAWSPSWVIAVPVTNTQLAVSGDPLVYQRM